MPALEAWTLNIAKADPMIGPAWFELEAVTRAARELSCSMPWHKGQTVEFCNAGKVVAQVSEQKTSPALDLPQGPCFFLSLSNCNPG